jgi:C-terminal processing protease CtpA/Prc
MKTRFIIYFILLGTIFSCKNEVKESSFKRSFLQSLNIIKKEYIKTDELNWVEIENNINDSIPNFQNNIDVYNGIRYTLKQINDKHSFFLPPKEESNFFIKDSISIPKINYEILDNKIGYIKILGFAANDSLNYLYSLKIRNALKKIDNHPNLSGWIIDLRNNKGGKAGTFSLGLAPLYRDTIIGYSINNKGKYITHKLSNNTYYYGDKTNVTIKLTDTLINRNKPIAVLVNEKTASLGESTAQSFKFQKNTLIFGAKTFGLTTDLLVYEFVSGARLAISTAYMCDENKKIIEGGLIPDVKCTSEKSLELAIEWIKNAI